MCEKYKVMARDAQLTGDRVLAEGYFQHADHFARLQQEAGDQAEKAAALTPGSAPASNVASDTAPGAGNGREKAAGNKGNGSVKAQNVQENKGAAKTENRDGSESNQGDDTPEVAAAATARAGKSAKTAVPDNTISDDKATDVSSDAG